MAFSPDGKDLVGTNWDETISLWEANRTSEARSQDRRCADARADRAQPVIVFPDQPVVARASKKIKSSPTPQSLRRTLESGLKKTLKESTQSGQADCMLSAIVDILVK